MHMAKIFSQTIINLHRLSPQRNRNQNLTLGWMKHQGGTVTINVNGSIDFRKHISVVGVIASNNDGHCIG